MNLSAAGLNDTEAKCYSALLTRPQWKPSEFAEYVSESRTNCYKILDSLVSKKLAKKIDIGKTYHYSATNPSQLLTLMREARAQREIAERQLEAESANLIVQYTKLSEEPTVRFYYGEAEIKDIYLDQIAQKQPIYLIRPDYNLDLYDFDFMVEIRHMARRASIPRYAITPDRPKAPINYKECDPYMLLDRTWIKAADYTAPVEWNLYGDKLAILSFGEEAIGMVIESPQIATAFKQLYELLSSSLRQNEGYSSLPKHAAFVAPTE